MKNNDKFEINAFLYPDASYAPVYIWVWNDICTREIIDIQLAEMQRLGIRAFYILPEPKNFRPDCMPTSLEPDYLSEEYFELCAYAVEQGKKSGMLCWIYDEAGWPSGSACGAVMKEHPEFGRETLEYSEALFSKGQVYKKSDSDILAAFINDEEIIEEGYAFTDDTVVTEYFTGKDIFSKYPDLLNKSATEYFINITHKKYILNDNITAVFTDEPKAPSGAFNDELREKYEASYGESVLPFLPLLSGRKAVTKDNVHILYHWYDLCSRMFCENFLLPCKKWANDNKIAFTGHMDKDHSPLGCMHGGGNFNLMRALRCLDIPGIDVIWRQLYPENRTDIRNDMNAYNGFYPRYASSAAAHNGTKLAMSEVFGVAGPGLTYDIMRFTVGSQAVRGINIFNLFNFPLGRKGQLLAQELPVFTETQLFCAHLPQINRYMERLSYIASLGERIYDTALYYPVSDFQGGLNAQAVAEEFDILGRGLEDAMVDFDIVDDDVIRSANGPDEGILHIGNATYRNIVIPKNAHIPPETQNVLNRFLKYGGKIFHNTKALNPTLDVNGEGLRVMRRKTENAEIYCLFREKGENPDYKISLPSSNTYLLDPESGELQQICAENGVFEFSLAVGETLLILITDEKLKANKAYKYNSKTEIRSEFTFRKETELVFAENGFENIKHAEDKTPVKLGDWSYLIGNAYSGSCIYETMFTLSDKQVGKAGEIDLGDVHFAASVYLNNVDLGAALMPPYSLRIPEGVLRENNTLRVLVTNTSANLYVHTNYFDKWKNKELSPYFAVEKEYAEDYASGGLYGPVVLYTE